MRHTTLLAILLGSLLVGCQDSGLSAYQAPGEPDQYARDDGIGDSWRLTKDRQINGVNVPAGSVVCGFYKTYSSSEFAAKPEFEVLKGDYYCAFGRRYGSKTFVRFDMTNSVPEHEQPTPYTDVIRFHITGDHVQDPVDRWFGVTAGTNKLVLLDKTGHDVATFANVADEDPAKSIQLMPASWTVILVHHKGYDRIYDANGVAMSPELSPLWTDFRNDPVSISTEHFVARVYGAIIDETKHRYWLLLNEGKINPKPDDCLGLQPLIDRGAFNTPYWRGWLVWWKTPAGERCAFLKTSTPTEDFAAVMASRSQAKWTEWTSLYDKERREFEDIRRSADTGRYELFREDLPMTRETFADAASATKYVMNYRAEQDEIARRRDEAKEQERLAAIKELQRWKAEVDAKERAAKLAETAAARIAFDADFKRGDKNAARTELLKIECDPERWTKYIEKYGLDSNAINDSDTIGYARAKLGGTTDRVLEAAVRVNLPPMPTVASPAAAAVAAEPQSDWDYFWNGPREGYTPTPHDGYQVDSRVSGQGMIDQQEAIRRRNADAWMRGAQNGRAEIRALLLSAQICAGCPSL